MSAHFNPPPGWPVPHGWAPPEDWEPDPMWPAAPPGWQFWADDLPDPSTETVRQDSYRPAESGTGPAASVGLAEFAYGAELECGAGAQLQEDSRSPASNDRIVFASVAGALVAALVLVGVVIFVFTHRPNTGEAGRLSTAHQSGSRWTAVPTTSPPMSSHTAPGSAGPMAGLITFDSMSAFVKAYYGELPGDTTDAWSKLDPHLDDEHGHQDYLNFWSSIESVSVLSVSPRDDTSVTAQLRYVQADGSVVTENRWLSFTATGGALRIYDSAVVQ